MFAVDSGNGISITRGDTATLEITLTGDAPGENDQVIAMLKKSARKTDSFWEKALALTGSGTGEGGAYSTWELDLRSEDTLALPFGNYYWDIRILYEDGQITTPFAPAAFNVLEVVTEIPEEEDPAPAPSGDRPAIVIRRFPAVTEEDNGKVLRVVDGEWAAVFLPSASGQSFGS